MRSFICVVPCAEDGLAPVEVAADAVEVDDAAAADFHGREGVGLYPATHYVITDLLQAHHLSQDLLRAERRVAEIGYALGISFKRKPHYTRLFHVNTPIIRANSSDMSDEHVSDTHVHNTLKSRDVHNTSMAFLNE